MNRDAIINNLAHAVGASRKQVIEALKQMSSMPEIQKYIKEHKNE